MLSVLPRRVSPRLMKTNLIAGTLILYLLVVAALTIVPTRFSRVRSPHSDHVNLVPFEYSFRCLLLARTRHPDLMTFCLRNTFGNILLFLPLGILLPLWDPRFRSIKTLIVTAACLSLSIEAIQFALRFIGSARAVDIDDVLLNTLGACLGFGIFRIVKRQRSEIKSQKSKVRGQRLGQRPSPKVQGQMNNDL